MAKRKTKIGGYEEDAERWAEAISEPSIVDRNTFDDAWNDYFSKEPHIRLSKRLREETFNKLRGIRPDIVKERIIRRKKIRKALKERRLIFSARIKGKIVKVDKGFVIIKGKKQVRYRDRLGRFASVKRK